MTADSPLPLNSSGTPEPVIWRRSARARRVSLRIDPRKACVVVTLPPRAGRDAGLALLRMHGDWIARGLSRLPAAVPLGDGGSVLIDGVPHAIRRAPGGRGGAWIEASTIQVAGEAEHVARRVCDLLRQEARRRLGARVLTKAAQANVTARRVAIRDTRSRWGSCSASGTLMFSWRLVMAPQHVQDYVVAHEVAHLQHMNHGKRFWALVETLTPHRTDAVTWLATEGPGLHRVG